MCVVRVIAGIAMPAIRQASAGRIPAGYPHYILHVARPLGGLCVYGMVIDRVFCSGERGSLLEFSGVYGGVALFTGAGGAPLPITPGGLFPMYQSREKELGEKYLK